MGADVIDEENSLGRRELSKRAKLERITSVARELFAQKPIDEISTAEVAKRAEIASGTLFLYAKTKGELLLLAQNSRYGEAHLEGQAAANQIDDPVAAILALMKPIIECNREHVENGRTYLLEVVFGKTIGGYRQAAIELMAGTESAVAVIAKRITNKADADGSARAKAAMAFMFLTLSSPLNTSLSVAELLADIETQLKLLFV